MSIPPVGAIFSSGMMEVARKGIFNPGEFMFNEIMIIFMAVMITDILLLDFFNTLGLPTSTTVSIVFELLGAAVAMAALKIFSNGGDLNQLVNYINTSKASQIIFGIILSVIVAFTVGAIVQWISRVLISFRFEEKPSWVGAIFSGIALTAITYFIFMKGLKGTSYADESFELLGGITIKNFLETQVSWIVIFSSIFWSALSYALIGLAKVNIYRLIIVVGTFALALAFAGNDLVNFIGVPVAAYNSYIEWSASGLSASVFPMDVLATKVPTNNWLLMGAGLIMVLTLWFSSKSKSVVQTSIDLSSQSNTKESFKPNVLSRLIVRFTTSSSKAINRAIPKNFKTKINQQFDQSSIGGLAQIPVQDRPAFDMVRAAVNLMVASVLISIATSMKLPLSTTYVTFMVAMGTSLADRAWGAESAVYRVAGVLNVIAGWFFTAIVAFTASGLVAYLMNLNVQLMFPVLILTAFGLLINSSLRYKRKQKTEGISTIKKSERRSIQGVINESADTIAKVLSRGGKIYNSTIYALAQQDLNNLKKNKKQVVKLSDEIEALRDDIFYFIKSLDEASVSASNFYIQILASLQDMTQSLDLITKMNHKHVNNNHKKLKFNQIKELSDISHTIGGLFKDAKEIFKNKTFEEIEAMMSKKLEVENALKSNIAAQIERTRNEESSPKNTTLYFSLLLETKDLLKAAGNLLEEYQTAHDNSIE